MEDFMILQKIKGFNGDIDNLFAIFDGHGGYLVSLFCKVVFADVLAWNMKEELEQKSKDEMKNIDEAEIIKKSLMKTM